MIPGNIYFQSVSGTGNTQAAFILELGALVIYLVYITIVIQGLKADVASAGLLSICMLPASVSSAIFTCGKEAGRTRKSRTGRNKTLRRAT